MTLYEYLMVKKCDVDTYDTEYDAEITVCHIYEEDDEYDKFCNGIIKKVNVVEISKYALTVDWSELIKRNIDKFKKFTAEHWYSNCQYEDDIDEFIYQWISEIHHYMVGSVSEDFYSVLNEFVDSLN